MAYLGSKMLIHLACGAQIPLLVAKKLTILVKYLDYLDIFSKKLAVKLPKRFIINKHLIDLKLEKQPLYGSIYSLESIELETLKTHIKTNLANGFNLLSKLSTRALIQFV